MSQQQQPKATIDELVALARAAAAEAANYQERFAAEDTEARKIVDIMEKFLRLKGRVVYGGAAINAHMSPENKFYDPRVNLPDYDFMTPDPLQDCADLMVAFSREGFRDVEAKFGIHEGTYKIFVNFRSAADITYMPPELYEKIVGDSVTIDGIHYASANFLRMNMYLELSRPAGMVSRWEKVYRRLLLLNAEHPIKAGRCAEEPLRALGRSAPAGGDALADRIIDIGVAAGVIFLSGAAHYAAGGAAAGETASVTEKVILMMAPHVEEVANELKSLGLATRTESAIGELLPQHVEFRDRRGHLVAILFETVACHSYTTLAEPAGYRLASIDLLIQMYYAMHFAGLGDYLAVRPMCVIQQLVDIEAERRRMAAAATADGGSTESEAIHDVFPMDCIGHQPTMPELKKAHRERVREKRKELAGVLRVPSSFKARMTKKRRRSVPPSE